jgi:hypothetical protein
MKRLINFKTSVLFFLLLVSFYQLCRAVELGTSFTYQGRLVDGNDAADGLYDFQFKLFDSPADGSQINGDVNISDTDVIDGYFTVEIDFGIGIFGGDGRWLEICIRPGELNDPNVYTVLEPRQKITATPYALYAKNSGGDNDWVVLGNNMYSIPSGNVGIGTTSPKTNLHIYEGAGGGSEPEIFSPLAIESDKQAYLNIITPDDAEGGILFSDNKYAPGAIAYSHKEDKIRFYTGGSITEQVCIDSSGRVGIGETEPTTLLHISKDATASPSTHPSTMMIIEDGDSSAYLQIMAPASSTRGVLFGESGAGGQTNDGMIGYDNSNGMRFWVDRSGLNLVPLQIQMDGDVIMEDGNVGIGTTNPSANLDVNGDIEAAGDFRYSSSKTFYKNIPPHAFNPKDNETSVVKYEIDDITGALKITAISSPYKTIYLLAPVDLPNGATVTKLTYFYYDNSTEGLFHEARLERIYLLNDLPLSTMAEIAFGVSGNSDTIQSICDTTISNATIDNQNYMYVLYLDYAVSDVSSGLAFCGIQIEYTMDAAAW